MDFDDFDEVGHHDDGHGDDSGSNRQQLQDEEEEERVDVIRMGMGRDVDENAAAAAEAETNGDFGFTREEEMAGGGGRRNCASIGDNDFGSISQFDSLEGGGHWFEIVKHDAREFYQVVKALAFREYCTMVVNNEGIRVVVDDQHNQQASAYFKYEQFSDYNLRVMVCNLRIPVNVFMETLNMFSSNTAILRMWYEGEGYPLMVYVEDEGIVVQVAIKTLNLQSMLDFEFSNAFVLCKAILNPNPMKDILRDLDTSADTVVIMFTPNYLSFYTVGVLGKIKVEIPSTSDQLEQLTCNEEKVCFQYRTLLIKRLNECVKLCNKFSLRVDQRGVLSVQFLIPQTEQVVFAEFYCVADDDIYHPDTS